MINQTQFQLFVSETAEHPRFVENEMSVLIWEVRKIEKWKHENMAECNKTTHYRAITEKKHNGFIQSRHDMGVSILLIYSVLSK